MNLKGKNIISRRQKPSEAIEDVALTRLAEEDVCVVRGRNGHQHLEWLA